MLDSESPRPHMKLKQQREALVAEALASWHSYQTTGLHLTGEEVRQWLQSWGTVHERPVPKCHK